MGIQLAWKFRTLIATGALQPGAQLPGIRELAELAGVNINTVRTVLARLEEQGLLITQQGRGNFVAENARSHETLGRATEAAIEQATAAGIDPRELAAAVYVASRPDAKAASATPAAPAAGNRGERQALRAQIGQLERQLAELEPLGKLALSPPDPEPRLLTADELRQVRDELAARIDALRRERQEWRVESQLAAAAEHEAGERPRTRRWAGAGVWTGAAGADVSWTTA